MSQRKAVEPRIMNKQMLVEALVRLEKKTTQKRIAEILDVREATLTRAIDYAIRELGWMERRVVLNRARIPKILLAETEAKVKGSGELDEALGKFAKKIGVRPVRATVLSPQEADSQTKLPYEARLRAFAQLAAEYVRDVMSRASGVCGITWGQTLSAVVDAMSVQGKEHSRQTRKLKIIPLCGEPIEAGAVSLYSSSVLANRFALALGSPTEGIHNLTMLPAFIPGELTEKERLAVWKLVRLIPSYRAIFGPALSGEQPLARRLDTVITGISAPGNALAIGPKPPFKAGGLSAKAFNQHVVADIGGVLIERPGIKEGHHKLLRSMEARWTGLAKQDLLDCVERASGGNGPGVLVIAMGARKADSLVAAIREGLLTSAVVDSELGEALIKTVNSARAR